MNTNAIENSDFVVGFAGYDNVKVQRLELHWDYLYVDQSLTTHRLGLNASQAIDDIPNIDALTISTENIDTSEYLRALHIPRITDLAQQFGLASVEGKSVSCRAKSRRIRSAASNGKPGHSANKFR